MAVNSLKDYILFENDNFIVINKPAGVAALQDRQDRNNILALSKDYHPEAQLCHRLDKETTGTLAIAKNEDAYRHLAIQFEKRMVNKIYHAVADGLHNFTSKRIELPLTVAGSGKVSVDKRKGKQAITIVDTLKIFRKHSLLQCQILTGRMHQIRVHLSSLGAPIAGDEQYGGKHIFLSEFKKNFNLGKYEDERPIMQRLALHSYSLHFAGFNDEQIHVEAPYPKDFAVLLKQLNRYN